MLQLQGGIKSMGDKGKKGVGCIINPKNWDWIDEELKDTDTLTIWISKTPNGVRTVEFQDMEE